MIGVQTITLDGWKGVNRTFHLGRLNLIKGANGSGKSAIITALRWACTGETEIGKDLESVLKFCAPGGASVTVTLTDGFEWTRSVARGVNGKNNSEAVLIAGQSKVNSTTAKVLIAEHIGDIAEAWGEAFLAKSAEEKRDRIVDLVVQYDRRNGNGTARDPGRILRDIKLQFFAQQVGAETVKLFLETQGCPCPDAATDEAIQALAEKYASAEDLDIIKRTIAELAAEVRQDLSETINAVLDKCGEIEKRCAHDAKQGDLTAEGIAKRKAEIILVGTPAATIREQLDASLTEEKALIAARSKALEQAQHAETIHRTIAACDGAAAEAVCEIAQLSEHPAATPEDVTGYSRSADLRDSKLLTQPSQVAFLESHERDTQQALTEASERLATAKEQAFARTRLTDEIVRESAEVERLRAVIGDGPANPDTLSERLAALESVKLPDRTTLSMLQANIAKATEKASSLTSEVIVFSAAVDRAEESIRSIKSGPWGRMMGLIAVIDPCVGQQGREPWSELCAIVAEQLEASNITRLEDEARELRSRLVESEKKRDTADSLREKLDVERAEAEARFDAEHADYNGAQAQIVNLRRRMADVTAWTECNQRLHRTQTQLLAMGDAPDVPALEAAKLAAVEAHAVASKAVQESRATTERLTSEAAEYRRLAAEATAAIQRDTDRRLSLELELERLAKSRDDACKRLESLGPVESTADLDAKHATIKLRVTALQTQLTARQRWETIDAEYKRAIADAEAHKRGHEIARGFSAAIRMVREAMMHAITAPLQSLMDRFFASIEHGLSSYVNIDNDPGRKRLIFNMGWVRNGPRLYGPESPVQIVSAVDQAALSGGEKPLFLAALADAIAVLADPPLRLLMLAVSESDPENLGGLIRGITARSDDVGSALVEVWEHPLRPLPELPLDGWNVIDMGSADVAESNRLEVSAVH